jgi:hypothetical protein
MRKGRRGIDGRTRNAVVAGLGQAEHRGLYLGEQTVVREVAALPPQGWPGRLGLNGRAVWSFGAHDLRRTIPLALRQKQRGPEIDHVPALPTARSRRPSVTCLIQNAKITGLATGPFIILE